MDINLDLTRRTSEIPRFVMQYEVDSRTLNFTILNNGVAYDLTGKTVTLCMEKPDGELIYNAVTVPAGTAGKCNITLTAQAQAAAGVAKCWVRIVGAASVTYSPQFDIEIREVTDFSGAVESTSEFMALDTALAQIEGFEARIGDQAYTEQNYITDDESVTHSIDALDVQVKNNADDITDVSDVADANVANIGTRLYTEDNYITDGDPLTTSIDDLDMALKEHADLSVLTGTVHGITITSGSGSLTPTASSGTMTTASATYSYYRIGKLLTYHITAVITDKGTGSGLLLLSGLPIQFAARTSGVGHSEKTGNLQRAYTSGEAVVIARYDNTTTIDNDTAVHVTLIGLTS